MSNPKNRKIQSFFLVFFRIAKNCKTPRPQKYAFHARLRETKTTAVPPCRPFTPHRQPSIRRILPPSPLLPPPKSRRTFICCTFPEGSTPLQAFTSLLMIRPGPWYSRGRSSTDRRQLAVAARIATPPATSGPAKTSLQTPPPPLPLPQEAVADDGNGDGDGDATPAAPVRTAAVLSWP